VFALIGALFCVIGGIGVVRLPEFYTRCHASGLADSAGAGALLLGLMFFADPLVAVKLLILVAFLWISSAVSTHSLAKAAFSKGVRIENLPLQDWRVPLAIPPADGVDAEPPVEERR
jgi:multicomponent Na+:H+ antiporter subunit G